MLSIRASIFIPQGTLPWQPILGKIGEMTFIEYPGILNIAMWISSFIAQVIPLHRLQIW